MGLLNVLYKLESKAVDFLIASPAHVLHLRCATSEFFGKPETFKHDGELMGVDMANLNSTKIVEGFSTFLFVAGGSHASHGNVYRLLTFRHLSKADNGTGFSPEERFRFRNHDELLCVDNTITHLPDIIGELAAIKSTVSDPPQGKYRVMSTIKIVSDVSVTMSMFESQWKAYGWIQGLLSLSQQS
ncbi:hypothetical protein F2Q70_00040816 [Brassica cretica]|uniref:Uncharacterized protein n=1 Tax=Brassica cretica TaxID=69181 RepID=A0A8S9KB65_BRACR|nr:hypothetical protein F2Q70_00040816 [Brassica cretica]KAF2619225.1 hypothetical protein F2Q68_00041444 [Brassica cretica]